MTRLEIEQAAAAVGLERPRVVPLRRSFGAIQWRLKWGPINGRRELVLPAPPRDLTSEVLGKAIEEVCG